MGRDADGAPDAPDLCFLCRKQGEKGRVFLGEKYVPIGSAVRPF